MDAGFSLGDTLARHDRILLPGHRCSPSLLLST
jgi:hypothetical protein